MRIKEAPVFLLLGLIISVTFLIASVVMYFRDLPTRGWSNQYLPSSIIFLLIAIYFARNLNKTMEEGSDDKNRCG